MPFAPSGRYWNALVLLDRRESQLPSFPPARPPAVRAEVGADRPPAGQRHDWPAPACSPVGGPVHCPPCIREEPRWSGRRTAFWVRVGVACPVEDAAVAGSSEPTTGHLQ